jgi:hypothetical protein
MMEVGTYSLFWDFLNISWFEHQRITKGSSAWEFIQALFWKLIDADQYTFVSWKNVLEFMALVSRKGLCYHCIAEILKGKSLILFWIKGIAFHAFVTIKTHAWTLNYICSRTTSVTTFTSHCILWFGKHCNTVNAKNIMLWFCILPTVRNTNHCESHEKRNHLPSLFMLHHTLFTSLFMFYTMPWNGKPWIQLSVNGTIGTLLYWKQYNTHLTSLYILHTSLFRLSS